MGGLSCSGNFCIYAASAPSLTTALAAAFANRRMAFSLPSGQPTGHPDTLFLRPPARLCRFPASMQPWHSYPFHVFSKLPRGIQTYSSDPIKKTSKSHLYRGFGGF
jgi:hypothetical protein